MKVKIGETVYDWRDQPIMVILGKQDKANIKNMHPDCSKYCCYPPQFTVDEIKKWMAKDE